MKKYSRSFLPLLMSIFIFIGASAVSAQPVKVAVLPFTINAVSDMSFLQTGIQDMLSSRLYWKDKVDVLDKATVNSAMSSAEKFSGKSLALLMGGKLGARFVVYGSLTMIGESASIDAKIVDVEGVNEPLHLFKQTQSINQVIPQINAFATDINTRLFQRPLAPGFEKETPSAPAFATSPSPNQNFIVPAAPAFSSGDAGSGQGFWAGPDFDYAILGMDFGDVNNDGIEEIVWISAHQVHIFQFRNGTLVPLGTAGFNRINSYIGVDVADINQNGTPEIFVTGLMASEDKVSSIVLEFDNSGFREIVSRSPWMYRVVKPANGTPVLLGQKAGSRKGEGVFTNPVYTMQAKGGDYTAQNLVLMGNRGNVLGLTLEDFDNTGENSVLAFDRNDYLCIYKNARAFSWKASEKLGGNMSRFEVPSADPTEKTAQTEYFPMRVRTVVSGPEKQMTVIAAANHDSTGNILGGFRAFSRTRIKALGWDRLGFRPVWETRQMSGRISDFFIADIDKDNVPELVISLVKKDRGQLVSTKGQSMILAYDLTNP